MLEISVEDVEKDLNKWSKKMLEAHRLLAEIYKDWQVLQETIKELKGGIK